MAQSRDSSQDETRLANSYEVPKPGVPPVAVAELPVSGYPGLGSLLHGRFLLEEELGRGGMGIVYKALDFRRQEAEDRDPYVAIKILNPDLIDDPLFLKALQRECKRSQNLPHPNIITVFDFDRDDRNVFMTMEYLDGKTLKQIIQESRTGVPLKHSWPWIQDMGSALNFAHINGIVHSDFKPGNVFLARAGIKVLDFGLASLVSKNQDHDRTLVDARSLGAYTPCYASLEALRAEQADPADDLYAFACTIYELLSGKHPYHRLTAMQAGEAEVKPKKLDGLSHRQWRALEQGLALTRAERRKTSVSKLVAELDPSREVNNSAWVAGAASLAVLAGLTGWLFFQGSLTPRPAAEPETLKAVAGPTGDGKRDNGPIDPGSTAEQPSSAGLDSTNTQGQGADRAAVQDDQPATDSSDFAGPRPTASIDSKLLTSLGGNSGVSDDGLIAVGVERKSYRIGGKLEIRLALADSRRVYVLYRNSQQEVATLYPNRQQKDVPVAANRLILIPPQGKSSFVLRVDKPAGEDRIVAIASAEKVDDPAVWVDQPSGPGISKAVVDITVTP